MRRCSRDLAPNFRARKCPPAGEPALAGIDRTVRRGHFRQQVAGSPACDFRARKCLPAGEPVLARAGRTQRRGTSATRPPKAHRPTFARESALKPASRPSSTLLGDSAWKASANRQQEPSALLSRAKVLSSRRAGARRRHQATVPRRRLPTGSSSQGLYFRARKCSPAGGPALVDVTRRQSREGVCRQAAAAKHPTFARESALQPASRPSSTPPGDNAEKASADRQ